MKPIKLEYADFIKFNLFWVEISAEIRSIVKILSGSVAICHWYWLFRNVSLVASEMKWREMILLGRFEI